MYKSSRYILLILALGSCINEPHNKEFELKLESIDIFLFNEVCDSYVHPAPFNLSGYGFRIGVINHSNDTLRIEFSTEESLLKGNQGFLTEFDMFKIAENIVIYEDYKGVKIQINPKDSFSFTLRETYLRDFKFKYFDNYLDNVLLKEDLKFYLNSVSINDSLGFVFDIKKSIPRNYFIDNEPVTKNDTIKLCYDDNETPPLLPLER